MDLRASSLPSLHASDARRPRPWTPPNDGLRIDTDQVSQEINIDTRAIYRKKKFWFNLLLLTYLLHYFFGQWLVGIYYYQVHYIGAALGDPALQLACASVKAVKNPWQDLEVQDWYRLQKCLGNEHGYERQGDLFATVSSSCSNY